MSMAIGGNALTAIILGFAVMVTPDAASAGGADVIAARAEQTGESWRFDVTVAHGDTGWDHYADQWEVLSPDGKVLGVRELAHPHENEQPFTRSLSGVVIPQSVDEVEIRARDSVHGWSGKRFRLKLER